MTTTDRIRVLRVIEYVGPRDWVERTVAESIHGTKHIGPRSYSHSEQDRTVEVECTITAVTLGEFGESIAESDRELTHIGTCGRCGAGGRPIQSVKVMRVYGPDSTTDVCDVCHSFLIDDLNNFHSDIRDIEVIRQ